MIAASDGVAFWGPVSEWVAGIGTLAAVALALWTSVDTERKRLKDKYASVFAWFERAPSAAFGTLYIKNSTEYPVYKWDVTVTWIDPISGEKVVEGLGSKDLGLLPPSKDPHQFDIHEKNDRKLPDNDAGVRVDMIFQDALGRQHKSLATWQRI